MHWVVQANMYNEEGFEALLAALVRQRCPHSVHKVVPFAPPDSRLDPEPQIPEGSRVMVMGTYTMSKIAEARGWTPGSFLNRNFHYLTQLQHWGSKMLNDDAKVCRLGDVVVDLDDEFFIRPTTDSKDFTGKVMTGREFVEWQSRVLKLTPKDGATVSADTEVLIASPKAIYRELRLWIVDGRAVTASQYKLGERVVYDAMVEAEILVFGTKLAQKWSPARAYCMDVFDTDHGLLVGEVNNFNSAGFYRADMNRLVGEVDGMKPLICDGCNVNAPWEHRCHGDEVMQFGERVPFPCECVACREGDAHARRVSR